MPTDETDDDEPLTAEEEAAITNAIAEADAMARCEHVWSAWGPPDADLAWFCERLRTCAKCGGSQVDGVDGEGAVYAV